MPVGGEKTLRFETDVEDHYFDRTEDPGDLQIAVLKVKRNESKGGDIQGTEKEPGELINVIKASPDRGTIKITFNPDVELRQGDEIEIEATLKGAGEEYFTEVVFLKIVDQEQKKEIAPKEEEDYSNIGLPELVKITKDQWEEFENQTGLPMGYDTVISPIASGDILEKIYINLDSNVYLNYRKKLKNENQIIVSQKRYVASVYFHSLFLYMITKKKNYRLSLDAEDTGEVTIDDYIRDVFDSYYSDFLLNFGMEQLMGSLED